MKAALCGLVGKILLLVGVGSIGSHLVFGGFLTAISLPVAFVVAVISLFLLWQSAELRSGDVGGQSR